MSNEDKHVKGEEYWTVIENLRGFKKKLNKSWKEIYEVEGNVKGNVKDINFPSVPSITKYTGLYKKNQKAENLEPKVMTLNFIEVATNMINYYIEPPISNRDLCEKLIDWDEKILINVERRFDNGAISGISGEYYGYTLNNAKEGRLTGNYLKIYPQASAAFDAFFVNRIETEELMEELLGELTNTNKNSEAMKIYKTFASKHSDIPSRFYTGEAKINKYSLEIKLSLEGKKNSFTKIMLPVRLYAQNGNAGSLYLGGVGMKISGLGFENYSLKAQRIALLRCGASGISKDAFSLNSPLIFPFLIGDSSKTEICVSEQEDRDFYTSVIVGAGNVYSHGRVMTDNPEDLKAKLKRYIDYLEIAQKKAEEAYGLCDKLKEM